MFVAILRASCYRKRMDMPVSDEEFAKIWRETPSVREMADRIGMIYGRVVAHARKLRAAGFDLPLRKQIVGEEEFRAIWVTSGSCAEVARRSGLSLSGVSVKAAKMRREGWDFPMLAKGRPRTQPPRREPGTSRSYQAATLAKRDGLTLTEAARRLGISPTAVSRQLYPGIKQRRGRPAGRSRNPGMMKRHAVVRDMASRGSTVAEIAEATGYSRQAVYDILRQAP